MISPRLRTCHGGGSPYVGAAIRRCWRTATYGLASAPEAVEGPQRAARCAVGAKTSVKS